MGDRLAGKVAIVTGAASGMGRAMVKRFVAEGASVVGGDIDDGGLASLGAEIGSSAYRGIHCDVTLEADQERLAQRARDEFGALDVAAAHASVGAAFGPILDQDVAPWSAMVNGMLTAAFLTIKHAGRVMVGSPSRNSSTGSIIATASLNATQPGRGMSAYCSGKAGIAMLVQVAAMELGPHGVRCNAIAPGLIKTPGSQMLFEMQGIADDFVENTTIKRYGDPDDVANLALFLASDESSYASGSLYELDGGGHTGRYPDLLSV
jgi:NAD(P)-dependent dehydrogenase (short-subunit alcohol dehydrogenase family)